MELAAIAEFLKGNWKVLAIGLLLAGLWFGGRYEGASTEKARWVAIRQAEKSAYDAQVAAMNQAAADKQAEYDKERKQREDNMAAIRKGLQDEISKNAALRGCIADSGFVRLYEGAASGSHISPAGQ